MMAHMSDIYDSVIPRVPPRPEEARLPSLWRGMGDMFLRTVAVGLAVILLFVFVVVVADVSQKQSCNVAVYSVHGEIATYGAGPFDTDSGYLTREIERVDDDTNIKALILDVDSPGGSPVAGEEIANALNRMSKPSIAVIRGMGASAAYWAATGADTIYASRSSDVGSIGVAVSFPDESEKNKKDGVAYNEFASGKFKNLGTPTRPVTKEEQSLLERDIDLVFTHFVEMVASARHMEVSAVRALADGSTMTGARALDAGLVDVIGGIEEARVAIEKEIGVSAVLCEPDSVPLF